MAKKPTKSKPKPKSAHRAKTTLTAGQTIEISGSYQSDKSKTRLTLTKGDFAPSTPLKDERWIKLVEMSKPQT